MIIVILCFALAILFVAQLVIDYRFSEQLRTVDEAKWRELGRSLPWFQSPHSAIASSLFLWRSQYRRYYDAELDELADKLKVVGIAYWGVFVSLILILTLR